MFINSRAVFLKKEFHGEEANAYKIKFDEVHKVEGLTHIKLDLIGESNSELVEAPLRRSDRVPH